jgi:uncharacterized protein (TIGR00369 family)
VSSGAAPGRFQQHLGVAIEVGDDRAIARARLRPDLSSAPDRPRLGFLATLADCAAGLRALLTIEPHWTATMDLAVHALGPVRHPALTASARLVHRRRAGLVIEIDVVDGIGRLVASAIGSFADLSDKPGSGLEYATSGIVALELLSPSDGIYDDIIQHTGIRPDGEGRWTVDLHDGVRNSADAFIGGAVALVVEAAAVGAVEGPGVAERMDVHFVGPGRVGPIVATPEVLGVDGGRALVRVRVVDAGAGDRLMADAHVTVRGQ